MGFLLAVSVFIKLLLKIMIAFQLHNCHPHTNMWIRFKFSLSFQGKILL